MASPNWFSFYLKEPGRDTVRVYVPIFMQQQQQHDIKCVQLSDFGTETQTILNGVNDLKNFYAVYDVFAASNIFVSCRVLKEIYTKCSSSSGKSC